jgi:hypothetical protein
VVERRQHARVTGPFEGHWHGGSGATEVRISDISLGGCFVETLVQPTPGEDTEVTICFTPAESMTIAGQVVYAEPGLGFAVKFNPLTPDQTTELKRHLHLDG